MVVYTAYKMTYLTVLTNLLKTNLTPKYLELKNNNAHVIQKLPLYQSYCVLYKHVYHPN